jgi:hypothetical protein
LAHDAVTATRQAAMAQTGVGFDVVAVIASFKTEIRGL